MTIDFHSHIYPDKIADKAARNVGDFYSLKVSCDGTAGMLLEKGSAAGIDKYVVHSVAQLPSQVESINNFISSMSASHPEFVGFGALHKDTPNPADEIGRIISLGLQGVKLHPDVQKFEMDDCAMLEIYSMLEGSLPVLIHCGDYRTTYSHPARLARILDLFPNLIVIAAHFGGWSIFDLALEHLSGKNCFLDVSSSIMFLGRKRSVELIRAYGAEKMLFGSDYPMWDPAVELNRFMSLDLSSREREMILSENALRLLESRGRAKSVFS